LTQPGPLRVKGGSIPTAPAKGERAGMTVRLLTGDCREVLRTLDAESVGAVVTDPPYELLQASRSGSRRINNPDNPYARNERRGGFMGKTWDATGVAFEPETWRAVSRVLKPGGHIVAFGGTRTFHRLTCAIEDAGFEIRDCLSYLYGSGFPKSHNLPGGLGTALKPAWEPIILARKPLIGTVAATVERHGTGALNIDDCRIEGSTGNGVWGSSNATIDQQRVFNASPEMSEYRSERHDLGRWPANVVLDEAAAAALDAQVGHLHGSGNKADTGNGADNPYSASSFHVSYAGRANRDYGSEGGGPSRFFYTAKASRSERNAGLDGMPERRCGTMEDDEYAWEREAERGRKPRNAMRANHHPTVKSLSLMRWLCRLITPPDGLILDPFTGSGTTGCAAVQEGFRFAGIEQDIDYLDIARRRIAYWTTEAEKANDLGPLFAMVAD
jgi:site-specific DNA-methyltransferase (adenine-specific)